MDAAAGAGAGGAEDPLLMAAEGQRQAARGADRGGKEEGRGGKEEAEAEEEEEEEEEEEGGEREEEQQGQEEEEEENLLVEEENLLEEEEEEGEGEEADGEEGEGQGEEEGDGVDQEEGEEEGEEDLVVVGEGRQDAQLSTRSARSATSSTASSGAESRPASGYTPVKIDQEARYREEIVQQIFGDVGGIVDDFSCAVESKILIHGRMYVTTAYLCFYSNLFGLEKKIRIPYTNIKTVSKENTAIVIPNAISVRSEHTMVDPQDGIERRVIKEYIFRSFWERDECFELILTSFRNYTGHDVATVSRKAERRAKRKAHQQQHKLDAEDLPPVPVGSDSGVVGGSSNKNNHIKSDSQTEEEESTPSERGEDAMALLSPPQHAARALETRASVADEGPNEWDVETMGGPLTSVEEDDAVDGNAAAIAAGDTAVTRDAGGAGAGGAASGAASNGAAYQTGDDVAVGRMQRVPSKSKLDNFNAEVAAETYACEADNHTFHNMSLSDFFDKCVAGSAPLGIDQFHAHSGDVQVETSEWHDSQGTFGHAREIRFVRPLSYSIGPSQTRAVKSQRYVRYGDHGMLVYSSTSLEDVPYSDCFTVEDRWIITPVADGDGKKPAVQCRIDFRVRFIKSTMFKKMIESNTNKDCATFFSDYLVWVKDKLDAQQLRARRKSKTGADARTAKAARAAAARKKAAAKAKQDVTQAATAAVEAAAKVQSGQAATASVVQLIHALLVLFLIVCTVYSSVQTIRVSRQQDLQRQDLAALAVVALRPSLLQDDDSFVQSQARSVLLSTLPDTMRTAAEQSMERMATQRAQEHDAWITGVTTLRSEMSQIQDDVRLVNEHLAKHIQYMQQYALAGETAAADGVTEGGGVNRAQLAMAAASIQQSVDGLQERLANVSSVSHSLAERLQGVEQNMGGLQNALDGLTQTMHGEIERLDANILTKRFKDLEQSITSASQSAIAGVQSTVASYTAAEHTLVDRAARAAALAAESAKQSAQITSHVAKKHQARGAGNELGPGEAPASPSSADAGHGADATAAIDYTGAAEHPSLSPLGTRQTSPWYLQWLWPPRRGQSSG